MRKENEKNVKELSDEHDGIHNVMRWMIMELTCWCQYKELNREERSEFDLTQIQGELDSNC